MKKIPYSLIKLSNVIMSLIPFLCCWFMYYEPRTKTVGSKQVSVLIIVVFTALCYYFNNVLDGYRISFLRIRDIVFSQFLALGVTDVFTFIIIWMLSIHFPNPSAGFLAFLVQILLATLWAKCATHWYFTTNKPMRTKIIYDVRQGMEDVIQAYRMDLKFNIVGVHPIEEAMKDPGLLKDIDAVFMCGVHSHDRNMLLKLCIQNDIQLFIIPRIGDVIMSGAEKMHMLHLPILRSMRYDPPMEFQIIKRLFDITVSAIALLILSPIMLVVALMIRSDGGPAIYKQTRLTKDGKAFKILKFRSMRVDAEKYSGAVLSAGENDPRITKIGRFIRACRLDELPQLINILKGDMSIVGPRPERPEIAAEYEKELPEFSLRLQAKAGLTGYAQVYGKYNTTPYDKLLMDLMYIANPSLLEDLSILLATVKILFSKESTEGVGQNAVETVYMERDKEQ